MPPEDAESSWLPSLSSCIPSCETGSLEHPGFFDKYVIGKPYPDMHWIGSKGAKLSKKVHGIHVASGPGFYGQSCAGINSYDPNYTITSGAYLYVSYLTVFHCPRTWRRHGLWALWAGAVGVASANIYKFPAEELHSVLERSATEFRFLAAVVLGTFITRAVNAWKERRSNYGGLAGSARALILALSTHLPMHRLGGNTRSSSPLPSDSEIDFRELRVRLGRYVLLGYELAVLKARGHMDSDEGREHLKREKLIEDGEWEAMQPGDRHTTVLWWIMLQTKLLVVDGYMSKQEHITIVETTLLMRGQANDLMSCMPRDLPYPYASVVGALVNFVIFLQSTKLGLDVRVRYMQNDPAMEGHRIFVVNSSIWVLELVVLFTFNIALQGLYNMHKVLHNPFGPRHIDIAHEAKAGEVRRLAEGMMLVETRTPPKMTCVKMPMNAQKVV